MFRRPLGSIFSENLQSLLIIINVAWYIASVSSIGIVKVDNSASIIFTAILVHSVSCSRQIRIGKRYPIHQLARYEESLVKRICSSVYTPNNKSAILFKISKTIAIPFDSLTPTRGRTAGFTVSSLPLLFPIAVLAPEWQPSNAVIACGIRA